MVLHSEMVNVDHVPEAADELRAMEFSSVTGGGSRGDIMVRFPPGYDQPPACRPPRGQRMSTLVYFSSSSENTQRFITRLGLPAVRIPLNERERIQIDEPYILVVPSYGGGGTAGAVPRQVIRF